MLPPSLNSGSDRSAVPRRPSNSQGTECACRSNRDTLVTLEGSAYDLDWS